MKCPKPSQYTDPPERWRHFREVYNGTFLAYGMARDCALIERNYGTDWLAYRRPPRERREHMTNADKIRAMSDEELTEFISRIEIGDFGPQVYGKTFGDLCSGQYECDNCRLWWLVQPAEEDT